MSNSWKKVSFYPSGFKSLTFVSETPNVLCLKILVLNSRLSSVYVSNFTRFPNTVLWVAFDLVEKQAEASEDNQQM